MSLNLIESTGVEKTGHLLDQGFEHVTVLDISAAALERAKARLGDRAHLVTWIESDITDFRSSRKYDL